MDSVIKAGAQCAAEWIETHINCSIATISEGLQWFKDVGDLADILFLNILGRDSNLDCPKHTQWQNLLTAKRTILLIGSPDSQKLALVCFFIFFFDFNLLIISKVQRFNSSISRLEI